MFIFINVFTGNIICVKADELAALNTKGSSCACTDCDKSAKGDDNGT